MESANNYRETEYHKILKAEEVKMKTTENIFFPDRIAYEPFSENHALKLVFEAISKVFKNV